MGVYTVFSLRVILVFLFTLSMAIDTSHGGVRTYATEEEVLNMAFPGADIEERTVKITPEIRKTIEDLIKGRFFKKRVSFYIARKGGEPLGYATVTNEKGRKRNITFMVVLDSSGIVKSVDLLVFRESQGYEIENPRWREQFIGKTLKDPLMVKRDIRNISGATMSSRAVTKGVKKVLAVFQMVRPLLE
jgi:Na+-translocating ferredoxin:NAD+ oxidoreductase RnfG subunit